MLKIPELLHGPVKDVRKKVSQAVRSFVAGASWSEAFESGAWVDVATTPGLLVLNGPAPLLSGEPHFNVFLPHLVLSESIRKGKLPEEKQQEALSASLVSPWGLLGVLSPVNQILVYPPRVHRPVLDSALQHWDVMNGVGPRYTVGLREGARLWDVTTNLHYVLAQVGVSNEQLRAPLPRGGLAALLPATYRGGGAGAS